MLEEFHKRNISHRWGGLFLHDDTVTQESYVIRVSECLSQNAPWMIPVVNEQMGNSGPETLYRSKLFISSPEQYPISGCINGSCVGTQANYSCTTVNGARHCVGMNATAGASAQQSAYGTRTMPSLTSALGSIIGLSSMLVVGMHRFHQQRMRL